MLLLYVVVVVVVVFVGAYSLVTSNCARQLHGSTPRDDTGPMSPVVAYIAAPVLAVAGTGTDEGRAVSGDALTPLDVDAPKGVDAPPDKGVDAPPDKGVGGAPDKGVGTPPDKGVGAPPDKGVDAPPDKGVDGPPGRDSAGAIRVARLLLALF